MSMPRSILPPLLVVLSLAGLRGRSVETIAVRVHLGSLRLGSAGTASSQPELSQPFNSSTRIRISVGQDLSKTKRMLLIL
jgi:hypothetical protein